MHRLRHNILFTLALRFSLLLFIHFILRGIFFAVNGKLFPEVDISTFISYCIYGVKFDLSTILYVNILYLFLSLLPFKFRLNEKYLKGVNIFFVTANIVSFIPDIIDLAYFPFTLSRSTSTIFNFVETENNITALLLGFSMEYWYAPLAFIGVSYVFYYLNSKIQVRDDFKFKSNAVFISVNTVLLTAVILLSIAGIRGGFYSSTRPMDNSFALKYAKNTIDVALILNTPFSIIRTFGKKEVKRYSFYNQQELDKIYPVSYYPNDTLSIDKKNIVIIILESFGKEYTGYFNRDKKDYQGFTPFLDSLMGKSKTFVHAYANGKKSIDAIPSIIASIPSLGNNYIRSHHSTNEVDALPNLLKKQGYSSAFYHGAPNGSMGFDAFCNHVGYDKYYGQDEYLVDHAFEGNVWGVFDEEFFQYFGEGLSKMKEPFLATFFSLSSHGPYVMPDKYKGKFRKGPLEVHELVHYTDYSLQQFFKSVENEPWFDNTLFVITADHTSIPYFKEYNNGNGHFEIPLVFYQKNTNWTGVDSTVTQQIDIMPTILSLINYPDPYFAFGRDLTDGSQSHFAINHFGHEKNYQLVKDGYIYMLNFETGFDRLYNVQKDRMLKRNLIEIEKDRAQEMNQFLKAAVQQYNIRLLDNKFTIETAH